MVDGHVLLVFILVLAAINTAGLSVLMVNSRRWTGPSMDVRIEQVEADTQSVRASLARIDRDLTSWHRSSMEANDSIMREVHVIKDSMTEDISVRRALDEASADLNDLKALVRDLPCYKEGRAHCPRCNEFYQMGISHVCPTETVG